jgi:hypothetical protein
MNDVLEMLRGMIAITQPFETKRDEKTNELRILPRAHGNFDQWERCVKLFNELAGTLAPYQSPRLKRLRANNDKGTSNNGRF